MKALLKKTLIAILIITAFLSLNACSKKNNEPNVNLTVEILNVTEQQFKSIGTSRIKEPSKDDFKNFKFSLDVQNSNNIKDRKISVPNFRKVFNNYEDDLYWFGQSSIQDNASENFAKYSVPQHIIPPSKNQIKST